MMTIDTDEHVEETTELPALDELQTQIDPQVTARVAACQSALAAAERDLADAERALTEHSASLPGPGNKVKQWAQRKAQLRDEVEGFVAVRNAAQEARVLAETAYRQAIIETWQQCYREAWERYREVCEAHWSRREELQRLLNEHNEAQQRELLPFGQRIEQLQTVGRSFGVGEVELVTDWQRSQFVAIVPGGGTYFGWTRFPDKRED
jgi:chromosome segregation ATPase